jgi:hypothetical protein
LCAAVYHSQILGILLKVAAKSQANSLLAYRDLRYEEGKLILKDAVLFDIKGGKSSYLLRSEEISLKTVWKWPLSFFVHVEKPRIIISPDHFKNSSLPTSKSPFHWSVELEEGVLEWVDSTMPSSQFFLLLASDESMKMGMSWERGVLEVEKRGAVCSGSWSGVPFDFLLKVSEWSGIPLPISDSQGTCDGHAGVDLEEERISLSASGKNLSFEWEKIRFGGNVFFEGVWEGGSVEKIRLSLEGGNLLSSPSEIKNIEALLTYQANLGIKCEGKGIAARESFEMPLFWEAKSFSNRGKFEWVAGSALFGKATGNLSWSNSEASEWKFAWEQFGPDEAAVLQGFAAKVVPSAKDWVWRSGTVQGEISLNDVFTPSSLSIQAKDLGLEAGSFIGEAKSASYKAGNWEIEAFRVYRKTCEPIFQGDAKWQSAIQDNSIVLEGEIAGIQFAGTGELDGSEFKLSIPQFHGDIPPCLMPNVRGTIDAKESGFEIRGSWASIEEWQICCRLSEGLLPNQNYTLSNVEFIFMANSDSIDVLSAEGLLSFSMGERVFSTPFFAPRIQWKGDSSFFDLRLHDGAADLLRLKGSKEEERFELDPAYSHFFCEPLHLQKGIWQEGSFSALDLEAELNWPLFESYLRKLGLGFSMEFSKLSKIHFAGHLAEGQMSFFSLTAPDWSLQVEKMENQWNPHLSIGPYLFNCALDYKEGIFRTANGHAKGPGISFDFEGTATTRLDGALILKRIQADLKQLLPTHLEGIVEGQAQVSFTKDLIESDLDLFVKEAAFEGFSLENTGPLHLYYSSLQGTRVKGLDCRIHKENFEAHAKVDLLKFDKIQNRWNIQKAKTHIPTDFIELFIFDQNSYIDCMADFSFASDFSDWSCTVKEAFFPIGGSMRHIKDLHSFGRGSSYLADALFHHKGKWAKASFEMIRESPIRGRLCLEEPGKEENPVSIDWSYQKEIGLSILSIEGAFAGIDASFHAFDSGRLIGSSRIDFRRFSEWVPLNVAKSFEELKMGKGYELKGNLQIDPKNLAQISFQGIFSGKQIELAGFQFRTLLARADLSPSFLRIYDLKISDSAGVLKIDDIRMKGDESQPWIIEMPKFIIEELRPSLLVKPGKEPGPISPLVVRQFKMVDFHGLLDEGKTWRAGGDLSFINSFKREQTVFDLPANVFGRIIGLDLELLIPVEGELTFELKDGFFNLLELKKTYSEGHRSEFFLARPESEDDVLEILAASPRMDLDGNLQILVKMKQFVLFSFTEAFMISIDGKLNDPNFRLQKKKRF